MDCGPLAASNPRLVLSLTNADHRSGPIWADANKHTGHSANPFVERPANSWSNFDKRDKVYIFLNNESRQLVIQQLIFWFSATSSNGHVWIKSNPIESLMKTLDEKKPWRAMRLEEEWETLFIDHILAVFTPRRKLERKKMRNSCTFLATLVLFVWELSRIEPSRVETRKLIITKSFAWETIIQKSLSDSDPNSNSNWCAIARKVVFSFWGQFSRSATTKQISVNTNDCFWSVQSRRRRRSRRSYLAVD